MKKTLFLIPFLFLTLITAAQDFQTEIKLIEALDFNGKTLAKAPAGKSQTLQLARTKFSTPLANYTSLALPSLKLGNIIGHPTLGWDDTDFKIPEGVPAVYDGKWGKEACQDFVQDIDGPESCNTNNMMKLTEDLHRRNPEARFADFYELAMFNHILSTQHPEHGGYVYFTSARPRHYRNYYDHLHNTHQEMRKSIYILLIMILYAGIVHAQDDSKMREIYSQAENDYQIGRIEQARDALLENLSGFYGNQHQSALRLIALCYLARFDMEKTKQYTSLMLQENPYYSPSAHDPAIFTDMVNSIKAGMTATISTASKAY